MNHYLILSDGAYSDYDPTYFCGSSPISIEELTAKGCEVGDALYDRNGKLGAVDQIDSYDLRCEWMQLMKSWLASKGYAELPKSIPEINIHYDIPHTKRHS